jgi:tetratricopeptide (TPR) repeat protein
MVAALGSLYIDQEKMVEAEAMYQRALAGYEKALGPEHPSTLDAVYNLGLLFRRLREWEKSIRCFERAWAGYETVKGAADPETVDAQSQVARTRQQADDENAALQGSRVKSGSSVDGETLHS